MLKFDGQALQEEEDVHSFGSGSDVNEMSTIILLGQNVNIVGSVVPTKCQKYHRGW